MAFDLAKYAQDLELDEADAATLAAILAKGNRATKFENGFRRQSDYDRTMDEGKKRIQAAADEADRRAKQLDESLTAVERLKNDTTGALEEAMAAARVAEERAAKSESALRRVAKESGLDPDEVAKSIGLEKVEGRKEPETPVFDQKKFEIEFGRKVGSSIRTSVDMNAEMADIQAEHMDLFGKPLVGFSKMVDEVASAKTAITFRQIWERDGKIDEQREQLAKERRDKENADLVAETEKRMRSELAMEGGVHKRRAENASPVFQNVEPKDPNHSRSANPALTKIAGSLAERRSKRIAAGVR